jgi:hypothetical protein
VHHSIVDGKAFNQFLEVWSTYVNTTNDGIDFKSIVRTMEPVDSSSHRRALDALLPALQRDNAPQHAIFPAKTPLPAIRSTPYEVKAKLQALTPTRVSTFTTLSALIWTHAMRARSDALRDARQQRAPEGNARPCSLRRARET